MRRILVDRARRRLAVRHGGELHRTEWVEDGIAAPTANEEDLLAVHEVLDQLAGIDPRKAEVVKLRYFIGMTIEESAEALGVSAATVRRDWTYAKAWLFRELEDGKGD